MIAPKNAQPPDPMPPEDWKVWAMAHANPSLPEQVLRLGQPWGNVKLCPGTISDSSFEQAGIEEGDVLLIRADRLGDFCAFYNESTRTAIAPQFALAVVRRTGEHFHLNMVMIMDVHVHFVEGRARPRTRDVPRLLGEHTISLHDVILSMDRFRSLLAEYCQFLSDGAPLEVLRFNSMDSTLCPLWAWEPNIPAADPEPEETLDFPPLLARAS